MVSRIRFLSIFTIKYIFPVHHMMTQTSKNLDLPKMKKLLKEKKQLARADAAAEKWKDEAEKKLAEAQAREEEALRVRSAVRWVPMRSGR